MSKIKAFENLPDIEVEGAETLEEAIEDCKALYAKFDKELDGTESTPLARCNEARLVHWRTDPITQSSMPRTL